MSVSLSHRPPALSLLYGARTRRCRAAEIRANGLLQPVSVRKLRPNLYQLVAGERRWRARQILGAHAIPAIVIDPPTNAAIRVAQIIENDQRQDVTPLEQARSYQALMDEEGWTVEQLAARKILDRSAL